MSDTIRIQYQTADGIKQYARVSRLFLKHRAIYRVCSKILTLDGIDRPDSSMDMTMTKRKYVLWTQLRNGTFVYREDN